MASTYWRVSMDRALCRVLQRHQVSTENWVLKWAQFRPHVHVAMFEDIFDCHTGSGEGAIGIYQDAAMHRTDPCDKELSSHNVKGARAEQPQCG